MSSIRAGAAFVTIQIKEEVRQGLAEAKSKLSAFADYVKNAIGGKASQALSFKDVAQGLVGGAVLMNLAKIALENEKIAGAAERANEALRSMVLDVTADIEGELVWALETAAFLIKKMADGFKAIIALSKDIMNFGPKGDTTFKNFNKVLDELDRPSSGARTKEVDKTAKSVTHLVKLTNELTQAQKNYDAAWEGARNAGAGAIADLQRELDVLRRGETSVKADEIYKDKLDAELKLLEAEKQARGQAGGFTNADNAAIEAARAKAQALKEQFVFLVDQKTQIEENRKLEEEAAKKKQEQIEAEIAKKQQALDMSMITRGSTSAFALGAGGRASGVGQTQRDLLKEAREQKEIAKKNLEQLEIIAKGGMVFG